MKKIFLVLLLLIFTSPAFAEINTIRSSETSVSLSNHLEDVIAGKDFTRLLIYYKDIDDEKKTKMSTYYCSKDNKILTGIDYIAISGSQKTVIFPMDKIHRIVIEK